MLCLVMLLAAFSGCDCWLSDSNDDEDFFEEDTACDCGGLGEALYQECSGAVFSDGIEINEGIFVQACYYALDNNTSEADDYFCNIEAFCDASDCEDFSRKLELCSVMP
jgi:hypothetical protein